MESVALAIIEKSVLGFVVLCLVWLLYIVFKNNGIITENLMNFGNCLSKITEILGRMDIRMENFDRRIERLEEKF